MNESGFWDKVRGELKDPPSSDANKLSAEQIAGTPDCLWAIDGKMGLLELKYERSWPSRPDTLIKVNVTSEQRRYLERIAATGNRAQVLLGIEKEWFLIEIHELPPAGPSGTPRMSRMQLEGIKQQGRWGTMKELHLLRVILPDFPDPVNLA